MDTLPLILWIIAGAVQLLLQIKYRKKADWFDYWLLYTALIAQLLNSLME